MPDKVVIKLNASSLPYTKCVLRWYRTCVQGYKETLAPAKVVYGIAVHAFIDAMYKTDGDIKLARDKAWKAFRVPKFDDNKSKHLSDETHLLPTCYNLWEDYVLKEHDFDVIMLRSKCFYCEGKGWINSSATVDSKAPCLHCDSTGYREQPATEVTFSIKYYEDDYIIVYLEGTLDRIGKVKGGCYAIRDWKNTSAWDIDKFLSAFEMRTQQRFYVLSLKLMAELEPKSILGQVGATNVGSIIDGIFLKPRVSENVYRQSDFFSLKDSTLKEYREELDRLINHLSYNISRNSWDRKEGILNGACEAQYSEGAVYKCPFWFVCCAQDKAVSDLLLKRDFVIKPFDPLHHNE